MSYISEVADAIRAEVPEGDLPDGDIEQLFLFYAVLVLTNGEATSARDVHNAWAAWMSHDDPEHESVVPFDDLDPTTKRLDAPFVKAIRTVARRLG